MKKIIGLALALAAAALVFVGCAGDETGGDSFESNGTKWEKTIKADDSDWDSSKKYRRGWAQLGSGDKVAGITTTIYIKKDGLGDAVVGLMFDYNKSTVGVTDAEKKDGVKEKKDFGLVGFNMDYQGKGAKTYYVDQYTGIPYKKDGNMDSNDLSLEKDGNVVREDSDCKELVELGKNTLPVDETEHNFGDGSGTVPAYKVVVNIRPGVGEDGKPNKDYDVYIGSKLDTLAKVTTYKASSGRTADKGSQKINVGGAEYDLPSGGICAYVNVKQGTKIVARYVTENNATKEIDSLGSLTNGVIGALKVADAESDKFDIIVE